MDAGLGLVKRILDRRDRRKRFILDFNQVQSFGCHIFIHCGNGGHRISHHSHSVDGQSVLILADGKGTERRGQIFSKKHGLDARIGFRFRNINLHNARVRDRAAQELRVQHSRKHQVVGILQFTGALYFRVHFWERLSNNAQTMPP